MFKMQRLMAVLAGKPRPKRQGKLATTLRVERLEDRLLLAKKPDLVPMLVEAPGLSSQTEIMVVETRVDNVAKKRTGQYEVQYFISLDTIYDPLVDRLLETMDPLGNLVTTIPRMSIPRRGSDHWEQVLIIPEDAPQGLFYVGVLADPNENILEKSETNNELSDTNQIDVLKGLPLDVCPGNTVEFAGTPYLEGVNCRKILVDGYTRTYVVYVPMGVLGGSDVPLVTMRHGSSGNGGQFLNISGWREKADALAMDEEGLIVAFPTSAMYCKVGFACETGGLGGWSTKWHGYELEGLTAEFNFDVRPPGYPDESPWPADDVEFDSMMLDDLSEMLDGLEPLLPVDTTRMYATGFSNGAGFTARLAVEQSDRYAAAAWVGGGLPFTEPGVPVPLIPTFEVRGTKDDGLLAEVGLLPEDEIELDPEIFLAYPDIANFVTFVLDTFDLVYDSMDSILGANVVQVDPVGASYEDAISTQLTWDVPEDGMATNVHHFAMWAGLTHHYPHGVDAEKNPNCFVAADTFWDFFELYQNL